MIYHDYTLILGGTVLSYDSRQGITQRFSHWIPYFCHGHTESMRPLLIYQVGPPLTINIAKLVAK